MDRLSSCYFCGDALEASLDEYPVVPPEFDPPGDVQGTVVLCRGCRRKLDSVLDTVLEAARSGPDGTGAADVESSLDGGEDLLQPVGETGSETDADPDGSGSKSQSPDDAGGSGSDAAGSDAPDTPRDRGTGASGGGAARDPSGGTESGGGDPSGRTAAGDDEPPSDGPGSGDDRDQSAGGASERTGAGADGVESETSLTRLEYNRVMRLLQNREFPVDRAGFVNVAANAYEMTPRDCDEIIDVAIDHGLIEERDGELVKPEE